MRLIDANAITTSTELTKKIVVFDLVPYLKVDDLLEFIDNLPTRYNVRKVVAELEKEYDLADKEKTRCMMENPLQFDRANGYASGIDTAIEIVKKGGVE